MPYSNARTAARLRIDDVTDDQVYFVSWRPGQEMGCPIRMTHDVFAEAWARDWARPCDDKMKLCPWCGSEPVKRGQHMVEKRGWFARECVNATCPVNPSAIGATQEEADADWNARKT